MPRQRTLHQRQTYDFPPRLPAAAEAVPGGVWPIVGGDCPTPRDLPLHRMAQEGRLGAAQHEVHAGAAGLGRQAGPSPPVHRLRRCNRLSRNAKRAAYMPGQGEAAAVATTSPCCCGQRPAPTGSLSLNSALRTASASVVAAAPLPPRQLPAAPRPARAGSGAWPGERVSRKRDTWVRSPT